MYKSKKINKLILVYKPERTLHVCLTSENIAVQLYLLQGPQRYDDQRRGGGGEGGSYNNDRYGGGGGGRGGYGGGDQRYHRQDRY